MVRDDIFPLTRIERQSALAGWRSVPASERWTAGRLAEKGLPVPDPAVAAAARRYAEYLLQRNRSNRLPRSMLGVAGVAVMAAGLFLFGIPWAAGSPAPWIGISGGLVATTLGLIHWQQRRAGRLLLAANPPAHQAAVTPL